MRSICRSTQAASDTDLVHRPPRVSNGKNIPPGSSNRCRGRQAPIPGRSRVVAGLGVNRAKAVCGSPCDILPLCDPATLCTEIQSAQRSTLWRRGVVGFRARDATSVHSIIAISHRRHDHLRNEPAVDAIARTPPVNVPFPAGLCNPSKTTFRSGFLGLVRNCSSRRTVRFEAVQFEIASPSRDPPDARGRCSI
jgi:hypothetical protein